MDDEHQWLHAELAKLPPMPAPQSHEHAGFHSGITSQPDAVRWIQIDLGMEHSLDAVIVIPAMLGAADAHGFPRRFRIDVSNDPLFAESTTLLDQTHGDVDMPLAPWFVPALKVKARHVRFTATKLVPKPRLANPFIFCLGELLVFSGGRDGFDPNQPCPRKSMRSLIRSISAPFRALSILTTAAERDGVAFFEPRTRLVLLMHRYECRSADKSLLRQAIRHVTADLKMSQGTDKLPMV